MSRSVTARPSCRTLATSRSRPAANCAGTATRSRSSTIPRPIANSAALPASSGIGWSSMFDSTSTLLSRRGFAASAAFVIVPRHVLGGPGYVPPSDKITLAAIGLGRQGMVVSMDLLARPEIQMSAVCDCNQGSKEYAEYSPNALLTSARRLLGAGYENWGEDL